MQPVDPEGVVRLVRADGQRRGAIAGGEVVRDGRGLGHPHIAIDQQRNGAEGVLLQIVRLKNTRREGQKMKLVGQPHLFQGPERAKRARVDAVIEFDHWTPTFQSGKEAAPRARGAGAEWNLPLMHPPCGASFDGAMSIDIDPSCVDVKVFVRQLYCCGDT
ncbi:hypothetical protein D3C86_1679570 [compost metagenome]